MTTKSVAIQPHGQSDAWAWFWHVTKL